VKEIVIIAGPNGSGKSTLAGQLDLPALFVNADLYEKKFYSNVGDKDIREKRVAVAVSYKIKECIAKGESFAFETVFATRRVPKFLYRAKESGYKITAHYVATKEVSINLERVAIRVKEGGHDVPRDLVIGRYAISLAVMKELIEFSDKAIVYDNSDKSIRPFLIKEDNQIKIIDSVPDWAEIFVEN